MASLVMIYPNASNARIPVAQTGVVLGRGADCDIQIDHHSVSRYHTRVAWSPQGWMVEDLGSTNGTYINECAVKRAIVREPDFLKVGAVIFKFIGSELAGMPDDGDEGSGAPMQATLRKPSAS